MRQEHRAGEKLFIDFCGVDNNLLNKLTQLKLPALVGSLIRQWETPQTYDELSFEERLDAAG
jgi:IstB-like ATP binding N-terminal.